MCKLFLFGRIIFVFSLIPFLFCSTSEASQDSDSSSVASFSSDSEEEKIEDFTVLKDLKSSPQQLPINSCRSGIQVFVINVDQGNFICVKNCSKKKIVIVDAGSSNSNFMKILEVYRLSLTHIFEGCTIAAVIITHLDKDHYSFLKDDKFVEFLDTNKVEHKESTLICGMSAPNQSTLLKGLKIIPKNKYNVIPCTKRGIIQDMETKSEVGITAIEKQINEAFEYSNAFKFCLPTKEIAGRPTKNDCSLVVQLSCEGGNVLFTGDATESTFDALFEDPKNVEIFQKTNFFVIPHHGADTAGSGNWLPNIVIYAKHNFVGAVVSANPMYTRHAHPRAVSVKKIFGKSAQKYVKTQLLFHKDKRSGVYSTRTHRCIYEPALLKGGILWLKLENGLSIFDNEAFFERGKPREPISPFFTPFTTFWAGEWVSVYSCIKKLKKLAKSDHALTREEVTNLGRNLKQHLKKMLPAHTAPMIVTNQYWMDLRDYYERVIAKTPLEEQKKINKLLQDILLRSPLPLGESSKKKQAVSYEDRSKSQPPLLSTVLLPVDGTPPAPSCHSASDLFTETQSVIPPRLDGYCIQDVPSDGNCGIWAVLVASRMITPIELANLMAAYGPLQRQYGYSPNWRSSVCQKALLEASPTAAQKMIDWRAKSKVGEPGDWIEEDHLPQLSEVLKKPIVVVYTINGSPIYTLYNSTERRSKVLEGQTIGQITREHPGAIFIYFDPEHRHFQAIVPQGKP